MAIHWVQLVSQRLTGEQIIEVCDRFGGQVDVVATKAFHQTTAVTYDRGYRVHYGSDNALQSRVLVVPGEACEVLGDDLRLLVNDVAGAGHRRESLFTPDNVSALASRVDVAADFIGMDPAQALHQMIDEWKAGRVVTAAKMESFDYHQSTRPGGGETAYFGSRMSQNFCRAYTRRGHLRIEFELKGRDIMRRFQLLEAVGTDRVGSLWRGAANQMVFDLPWYRSALLGERVRLVKERADTALQGTIEALRSQWGKTIWTLRQLGLSIDDLTVQPDLDDRRVRSKLRYQAKEAAEMGFDSSRLLEVAK